MIRRPPRSTRTDNSVPTRRSSDRRDDKRSERSSLVRGDDQDGAIEERGALSELARLLQHLAGGAEAFHRLRHAAVDADDVAGRADLLDAAAVGEGAAAVGFPFVLLAAGAAQGAVDRKRVVRGKGGAV